MQWQHLCSVEHICMYLPRSQERQTQTGKLKFEASVLFFSYLPNHLFTYLLVFFFLICSALIKIQVLVCARKCFSMEYS